MPAKFYHPTYLSVEIPSNYVRTRPRQCYRFCLHIRALKLLTSTNKRCLPPSKKKANHPPSPQKKNKTKNKRQKTKQTKGNSSPFTPPLPRAPCDTSLLHFLKTWSTRAPLPLLTSTRVSWRTSGPTGSLCH